MELRFLSLLTLVALLTTSRAFGAQPPLGSVAAIFSYTPSKVLADPVRTRVYATDTASNSVVIIDTTTLKVIATIPIGSDPVDMAISPDGNTLYVANGGSTLSAIAVLDLNTLTVRATYSLSNPPVAIVAGLANRVYVSASPDGFSTAIYQLDGTTGVVQTTFNSGYYDNNLLTLSPDGSTLFVANNTDEPGDLKSFNVSTATPAAAQVHSFFSTFPPELIVSHNGKYLCLPSYSSPTDLYSTTDITAYYGSFSSAEGAGSGPLAFSLDDSLVYQVNGNYVDVFSTTSFTEVNHVQLAGTNGYDYSDTTNQVVIDNTGSYLFIGATSYEGTATSGQLIVITTGAGTLTPLSVLPVITSSTSDTATQYSAYTYQITAANTPTSFNATGLPAGLSVNTATGLISGTPTVNGYYDVMISATNASGTAMATLDLEVNYGTVNYVPVITTSSLPAGASAQSYTQQVMATNTPYLYSATGLPDGLSIDSSTGVISGTPTATGIYTVNLEATNYYGTGTATVSLTITLGMPVITSGTAVSGRQGSSFVYQITATNNPTSYAATGLPAGLSINATYGLISGTPTVSGSFPVTLSATNATGTGTANLTLTVATVPIPAITSASTASATQGQYFAYYTTASNNPTSFAASGLPAGLSINTVSGLILGTPSVSGTYSVTLSGTNAIGTGSIILTLTVAGAAPVPVVTSVLTASAQQGQAFSYQVTASNSPTSFAASGLPDGLVLDTVSGLITGTPTQAGIVSVALSALNANGTGTATLSLNVVSALPVVTLVATTPTVTAGSGDIGGFTLVLSEASASDVVIGLEIKGTAVNGTDYVLLKTTKKIKAGHMSKPIKVIPLGAGAGAGVKQTVVLTLQPGAGYMLGTTGKVKVKIIGQ